MRSSITLWKLVKNENNLDVLFLYMQLLFSLQYHTTWRAVIETRATEQCPISWAISRDTITLWNGALRQYFATTTRLLVSNTVASAGQESLLTWHIISTSRSILVRMDWGTTGPIVSISLEVSSPSKKIGATCSTADSRRLFSQAFLFFSLDQVTHYAI